MTINEFMAKMNLYVESHNIGDWQVCIPVSDGGFPGKPVVLVRDVAAGFDWDHGKFLLYPEKPLFTKPKKAPKEKK